MTREKTETHHAIDAWIDGLRDAFNATRVMLSIDVPRRVFDDVHGLDQVMITEVTFGAPRVRWLKSVTSTPGLALATFDPPSDWPECGSIVCERPAAPGKDFCPLHELVELDRLEAEAEAGAA